MPNHRDTCLSSAMLDSERAMVYALAARVDLSRSRSGKRYCITASQSQGFQWNQDLFVDQYQQVYSVEYDAMSRASVGAVRPRRRSENCISLTHESKTGACPNTSLEDVEVDSDTPENVRLRALLGYV